MSKSRFGAGPDGRLLPDTITTAVRLAPRRPIMRRWRRWSVAYTPDWESLADALKRVMASGVSENEAKTDLCGAVADRKIRVRVRIEQKDRAGAGQVFSGGNVGVPTHLNPKDFDWAQSRPTARWSIGPKLGEHYTWVGGWKDWPLGLIELSTADVIEVLCGGESETTSPATARHETAAITALAAHFRNNPELIRSEAAAWLKASGFNVSNRGFQSRVWPGAREKAGLTAMARSGRKKKNSSQ